MNIETHHNQSLPPSKPEAGLYLIATPIGNLRDITLRALDVLKAADALACEDTRHTNRLLSAYGIKSKLYTYNDHTPPSARRMLVDKVIGGGVVGVVSDAGTPLVSDPGQKLVQEVLAAGGKVFSVPGPSAAISALVSSGIDASRFFFQGFLPAKTGQRIQTLKSLKSFSEVSLVFYESPKRLAKTLHDMAEVLGGAREAVVMRELTKLHEEAVRGTLVELHTQYSKEDKVRGEIVIVVAPLAVEKEEVSIDDLDGAILQAMKTMSVKDLSEVLSETFDMPKKEIYARALKIRG
ncbi:MAG: 16S rRNA (cytidine(1402)-2'-O)-methyltransferase [Proteobacteria bacterium]|nr:16S rRNA (cytidine(1402)-2'-O)-methyltransferase [Pseudomonadota bacterium]